MTERISSTRFQQLTAVRIQGVIPPAVSLDSALTVLETEAAKILPAGYIVDYAGESRQLRVEGSKFLGFTTLNIYSQVGLITLVGLVAKNGILIVEFANQLQRQGFEKLRAVTEASTTRLRPILMTTAATVMGHTPLIIATGPGTGARNSIGIMLVSGMIIGSAFTLFVVPSIYMLVARRHRALESVVIEEPEEVPSRAATAG